MIRIGGPPPHIDDEDDDDDHKDGIPPEILDLIRMTEMLSSMAEVVLVHLPALTS